MWWRIRNFHILFSKCQYIGTHYTNNIIIFNSLIQFNKKKNNPFYYQNHPFYAYILIPIHPIYPPHIFRIYFHVFPYVFNSREFLRTIWSDLATGNNDVIGLLIGVKCNIKEKKNRRHEIRVM